MAKTPKAPVRKSPARIETFTHAEAIRKNIPTAEYQSVMDEAQKHPLRVAYERRNKDLDPQLVWRGKDARNWSDLVVHAPPVYIREKIHPKAVIDADFNGLPDSADKTDFYQHDAYWAHRMIRTSKIVRVRMNS